MITKISVAGMAAHDLCQLDYTDPPLSIERDLGILPVSSFSTTYKSPSIDPTTYWQHGGPHP